jgi:hypothetical protein
MRRFIYEEPVTAWAVWSRRIALFALVVLGYAIVLVRGGAQDLRGAAVFGSAFALIGLAALAALVAFVRIWRQGLKGTGIAAQALLLVLAMSAMPGFYLARGLMLPRLNDVSTDIDEPPAFSRSRAVLAARNGRVPPEVDKETRQRQRAAYPAVVPLLLDNSAEDAFELARRAALSLGWRVLEQTPPGGRVGSGRIEASHTTTILK